MDTENITMLVWATEHPFLYTIIKVKAALVAAAVASIVSGYFKYKVKSLDRNNRR